MKVLGIGIDLSMTEAFRKILVKRTHYLRQFCTQNEILAIESSVSPVEHAHCIFAAKEAVGKAFGTGLVEELWFDDIEISHRNSERLLVSISTDALAWARRRFEVSEIRIKASCCQTADFVSVICILQGDKQSR